jgi:uncharacterized membrane protein
MEFLGPFHPQIVHFPVALILVSLLFELIGRLSDIEWWRKAAFAMLVVGVLGAWVAVQSGEAASEKAEHSGIPESTVDRHGDLAKIAFYLGLGAVVTRALAGRLGNARSAVAGLGLLLHIAAAGAVGVAGHRGGQLVFEHGAAVKVNGVPVLKAPPGGDHEEGEHEK